MFFAVEDIARVCHEANRAIQAVNGEEVSPPWSEAEPWMLVAATKGVKEAAIGITPAQLHAAWYVERAREGWTWGPWKDAERMEHPCLVAYDQLPVEQRVKDAVFLAIVNAMRGTPGGDL